MRSVAVAVPPEHRDELGWVSGRRAQATVLEQGDVQSTRPSLTVDGLVWIEFDIRKRVEPDERVIDLTVPHSQSAQGPDIEPFVEGYQNWLVAMYLQSTSLKGVSSMKLRRELGISQKASWFLAHRVREMWRRDDTTTDVFFGPIEADEAFIGGKVKSMSASRRKQFKGRGLFANKAAVAGVKDRHTNQVRVRVIGTVTSEALRDFVDRHRDERTKLFTDEAGAYEDLINHEAVKHSAREYVKGENHTQGIESFWSMLKRGYVGTYHRMSFEHLPRYATEFEARHNCRDFDTEQQLALKVQGGDGRVLPYAELVKHGERAVKIALGWKPPVHWRHRKHHRKTADTNDTPAT